MLNVFCSTMRFGVFEQLQCHTHTQTQKKEKLDNKQCSAKKKETHIEKCKRQQSGSFTQCRIQPGWKKIHKNELKDHLIPTVSVTTSEPLKVIQLCLRVISVFIFPDCSNVHLNNQNMCVVEKGEYCKPKQLDSNSIGDVLTQLEPIPGSPT